ncbi:Type I restriction-modification system S subunit [Actinobacillus pleuropneumoniae]|nr:Type I restriction-modification system S subunit [Actinobacillus pleuropneumoniae]
MGNLQDGEIDWGNLAYSDDEEDIKKYILQPGDVLFNRTNSPELVGKTSIYRGEYPAIFAGYIIRLKYDNKLIDGEYLNFVMNSVKAKKYCNSVKSDGVNQSNINAQKIAAFILPVPSLEEQKEIVRILNRLLGSEKNAKDIMNVIERIGHMKKAILARSFRGELGTNDPIEESAKEILKEILINSTKETEVPKRAKSIKIDPAVERELKTNIERQIYLLLLREGQASITNLLFASDNYFEITQALNRLVKTGLIYEKDGVYLCRKG